MKNLKQSIKLFICAIALALESCSAPRLNINDRTLSQVMSTEPASIKQAVIQEIIPIGQRVRDVREGTDGFIYILTDEQSGQLIRLEPKF